MQVGGNKTVSLPSANVENVNVQAGDGSDTVNVSRTTSNTQIFNINGGDPTAGDTLTVTMSTNGTTTVVAAHLPTRASSTARTVRLPSPASKLSPSPAPRRLRPTSSPSMAPTATIPSPCSGWGLGSRLVNNRAVVTFANYGTVNLNGQFGEDTFSVTPVGLAAAVTTINVSGGDPTASDSLLVNGTAGNDVIGYNQATRSAGSVTITGAPPP